MSVDNDRQIFETIDQLKKMVQVNEGLTNVEKEHAVIDLQKWLDEYMWRAYADDRTQGVE